ncbi:MAG: phospho-sugar mutase [Bacteroidales bacterium]|nr:phospho-sugar mutase [Bacteroidales bacterium]
MDKKELLQQVKQRAEIWLDGNFDKETKARIADMMENDEDELIDAFYKDLEFGTGGLRGIMGVGTNRMNIYTVGMATQGLCNYIKKEFIESDTIKVAVAYDCRNNSRLFAETAAKIFSANQFKVYLFESLRPTPELSYAIRFYGCQSGIVITASHNPKEYNGFKAYWSDGGQVISPHDKNIIQEAQKITDINEVRFEGTKKNIQIIGNELDERYTDQIKTLSLSPEIIERNKDLKIVYTPIHGTGVVLVPLVLKKFGFQNIYTVPEQDKTDGNFPTVYSPNPEEPAALAMALDKAREVDADLVMATDPDGDRVGIAVKNHNNEFVLLNGNQTAALLVHYLLSARFTKGKLKGNEYIIKTIVTSELLSEIAEKYNVEHFDVLTGFKYIADIIKKHEGKKEFIVGGEESYGYLAGEFVRDKDAVMSCALIAEATAWAKDKGKSLYDQLIDIYLEYGFYHERLVNIVKKGKSGAEEIQKMMDDLRNTPPETINNSPVMLIHDFQIQTTYDLLSHLRYQITLPKSNVLQFILKDGSKISVRPSGTEPKIKFYYSVKGELKNRDNFEKVKGLLEKKIDNIILSLGMWI